jgi:hypothetical protein
VGDESPQTQKRCWQIKLLGKSFELCWERCAFTGRAGTYFVVYLSLYD